MDNEAQAKAIEKLNETLPNVTKTFEQIVLNVSCWYFNAKTAIFNVARKKTCAEKMAKCFD